MSNTGKQSPLGVNIMSGLLQGKGFWINNPTASYVGSSTSSTTYTPGSIVNDSCLYWATYAINASYGVVDSGTYANITTIGSNTIPALGNSPPPTYTYTGSPSWAGAGYTGAVSRWGYVRLFPWQGYNEYNYNSTLPKYNDFCGSFISAASFIDYSNKSIMTAQNSLSFLKGTYSNMDDLTAADVTNVSISLPLFGKDLINLGKALDLTTIETFGYPSNLLATIKKYNGLTASLRIALLSSGLTVTEVNQVTDNVNVSKLQQQQIYAAFLIVKGIDLAEILVSLNCNTPNLDSLADLLDIKKMFPNSYQTITVPVYNANPGPTNSKTFYPIYATDSVNGALTNPTLTAQIGTIIPPGNPPIMTTAMASTVAPAPETSPTVSALDTGLGGNL
jgi:hypothetical protein